MSKSENAFRTITEAAAILDLPPHVLRFWESKFKNIKPMKRGGGRRYYRPEDLNLLRGIKFLLYSEGLTIKAAQKIIQTKGVKNVSLIGIKNKQESVNVVTETSTTKKENFTKPLYWPLVLKSEQINKIKNIDNEKLEAILIGFKEIHQNIKMRIAKYSCTND